MSPERRYDVARAREMQNLAITLRTLFEQSGDFAALQEAMALQAEAFGFLPPGHLLRSSCALNMTCYFLDAYRYTKDVEYVDNAVTEGEYAAGLTPAGRPLRSPILVNLGVAHLERFDRRGHRSDLEAAETHIEEALAGLPAGHRSTRAKCCAHLGGVARRRFGLTQDRRDLDRAVEMHRRAVAEVAEDDAQLLGIKNELGTSLSLRSRVAGRRADHDEARGLFRSILDAPRAPAVARLGAARADGDLLASAGAWEEALASYTSAIELLPLVASPHLYRSGREQNLSAASGLAADAAACALRCGRDERAVELVEQGRGVLQAQQLDGRSIHHTSTTDPAAARLLAQLREVVAELEDQQQDIDEPHGLDRVGRYTLSHRGDLEERYTSLVDRIRERPGLAGFLRPPRFRELARAAGSGAVVVVNVSQHRSDALVVRTGTVTVLPLEGVSPGVVTEHVLAFGTAVDTLEQSTSSADRSRADARARETMAWLWRTIGEPVLTELGHSRALDEHDRWPRVWWCATGQLGALPLHAAGTPRRGECVLDRVVSSYATTLRSLRHDRDRPAAGPSRRSTLVVTMPETPDGWDDLPYAAEEARRIARVVDTVLVTGAAATRERVVEDLPRHPGVHFACHAAQNYANPSDGLLLLHDFREAPLDMRTISRLRLPHAELAFLSACQTAVSGSWLADEGIHVAAAFQLAGFAHVVATLWPITDEHAPEIAETFYRTLREARDGHPVDPGTALHHAVLRLRRRLPERPVVWGAHIHFGP